MSIEEQLEVYAQLVEKLDFLTGAWIELKNKAIPNDVKKALEDIDAEYTPMIDEVQKQLSELKNVITQNILTIGETVKGSKFMAVWNKGRSSWDGKALDGFAMAHPEILAAKKIGEPTVSFREVK